ncbi:MAG TPA: SUF system NifU family Fe-S cluster assembly protein [Gemmatimonadaceae bacterium]|nr:SUF system NifU family Fe-S cluster assembly protein [Gemmatimonadaceae bacterium]
MSPAEIILTHHRRPHHRGTIDAPDGVATRHNPLCGETLTVGVTLDTGRLSDVRFDGESCSIGRASASMMTDLVVGLTPDEVGALTTRVQALVTGDPAAAADATLGDLRALAEVRRTPARAACALLPWNALADALAEALDARLT